MFIIIGMERLTDFYVDINGDIKGSEHGLKGEAKFVSTQDKLNSIYYQAFSREEILRAIQENHPESELDIEVYRTYAKKIDPITKEIKAIKIYCEPDFPLLKSIIRVGGLKYILFGLEIHQNNLITDHYFIGTLDDAKKFVADNGIIYSFQEYETHKPILYSVKLGLQGDVVNFKVYYTTNEMPDYDEDTIQLLKNSLKF